LTANKIRTLILQLIFELLIFEAGFRKKWRTPIVRNAMGFGGGSVIRNAAGFGGGSVIRNAAGFGGGSAS